MQAALFRSSLIQEPWGRGLLLRAESFLELSSILESRVSEVRALRPPMGRKLGDDFQWKVYPISSDCQAQPRAQGLLLAEAANWQSIHCAESFFFFNHNLH